MTNQIDLHTKEQIKERLLAHAGILWEKTNNEPSEFDPFVDLLMGAFASEMERISNKIENVESSVIKRVLELIIPEASNKPQPAYSVINLSPKLNEGYVDAVQTQFSYYSSKLSKELYFTPAGSFKVVGAEIKNSFFGNKSYQYISSTNRIAKPLMWSFGGGFPDRELWIGLKLNAEIENLEGLSLYFDWQNQKRKNELLSNLHGLKITHNNQNLPFSHGIKDYSEDKTNADSLMQKHEQSVRQELNKHFITFEKDVLDISIIAHNYPKEWEQILPPEQLSLFSEPLVWLKLLFPPVFNVDLLDSMTLMINCVPVINRKVNNARFQLKPYFNVFPLQAEPAQRFFEVISVSNSNGIVLNQAFDFAINDNHTFILRTGDIARFDKRDALQSLNNVVNLVRDESYAFIAAGGENENEILQELKTIQKLQTKIVGLLPKDSKNQESGVFIVVQTNEANFVECQYWTSDGLDANTIKSGEQLSSVNQGNLFDSVVFVQPVLNGREKLPPTAHINLIKKLLLSRNRIITHSDLKIAILSDWEGFIVGVTIEKQIAQLSGINKGIKPVLMITLVYNANNKPSKALFEEIETSIFRLIEEQSAIPINSLFRVNLQWKINDNN